MEKTEEKLSPDDKAEIKKLLEENLEPSEGDTSEKKKQISSNDSENPDYDDYYEVNDEEPELKLKPNQTAEQYESESGDYY